MHAVHLGGSHYTQYLGLSAGITAVLLAVQPLLTALVAARWMGEPLYQRAFCPLVDLRSAALIQFVASIAVLAPLAWGFESVEVRWSWPLAGAIVFLVIGASILAVNALHTLMRRGQAARVASLIYLTPVFPVVLEFAFFGITPGAVSSAGILITCAGVGLASWRPAGHAAAAAR
jgi:drug/metabolite transporter (DMT)-like permease